MDKPVAAKTRRFDGLPALGHACGNRFEQILATQREQLIAGFGPVRLVTSHQPGVLGGKARHQRATRRVKRAGRRRHRQASRAGRVQQCANGISQPPVVVRITPRRTLTTR